MTATIARTYTAPIDISAAFTAQIDIFEIIAASGKPCALLGFEIGQTSEIGDNQEEWLTLLLKNITGAPTSGSGGGTPTFIAVDSPNSTAPGVTIETGNTTKLTGGTSRAISRHPWMVRSQCLYIPVPEARPVFDAGTRLVLELVTTPADSISAVQGWVTVGELI